MRGADNPAQDANSGAAMERAKVATAAAVDLADLPLPVVLQINALADEFEAIWHSGRRPRIEDFLVGTDRLQHDALLYQLIPLDADYRHHCGELAVPYDYLTR